jgi:hypothetical protein
MYITSAFGATFSFSSGLAIGTKPFLSFGAPINSAGEFVISLSGVLVIHFLVPQMLALKPRHRGGLGSLHNSVIELSGGGKDSPFYGGLHQLNFVAVFAERLGSFRRGLAAFGGERLIQPGPF